MNYYTVLKNYLENAEYGLDSADERIDFAVARGRITGAEAQTLHALAAERATEPPLAEQVNLLMERLAAYEGLVAWQDIPADTVVEEATLALSEGSIFRCIATHTKNGLTVPAQDTTHWQSLS